MYAHGPPDKGTGVKLKPGDLIWRGSHLLHAMSNMCYILHHFSKCLNRVKVMNESYAITRKPEHLAQFSSDRFIVLADSYMWMPIRIRDF